MDELIYKSLVFQREELEKIDNRFLNEYPIVYVLYDEDNGKKRPEAYIGETTTAVRRMRQHLDSGKRIGISRILLIGHKKFNQSATYNIESNLINAFLADEKYQIQNVSQTKQRYTHNYYQKSYYNQKLFYRIWDDLHDKGIVTLKYRDITNKDIFKLSPFTALSPQQEDFKNEIIHYCEKKIQEKGKKVFLLTGDAGSGKSVVMMSLFHTLSELSKDNDTALRGKKPYLLVNHSEMLKTYQSLARLLPNMNVNQMQKPTSFINNCKKGKIKNPEIVFIDEAHLLLSQSDSYNGFKENNHLEEILKLAKIVVIVFDPFQVLRTKSFWTEESLIKILSKFPNLNYQTMYLSNQFRMQDAEDVVRWIDSFVRDQKVTQKPKPSTYDFRIFDDPEQFKKAIWDREKESGLSRMVATFDYEHKKDGKKYYVDPEGIDLPWNTTTNNTSWAENPRTKKEIGSIYTIQGFDLNYVGVILGPSVDYDFTEEKVVIDISKYQDKGAVTRRHGMTSDEHLDVIKNQILNSINILMKRGVKGLYIYAVNDNLRRKLKSLDQSHFAHETE